MRKLLLLLTIVDIRAVGPGTWNGWKRQLLTDLYEGAEEVLRLGHKQRGRSERIAAKQQAVKDAQQTLTDALSTATAAVTDASQICRAALSEQPSASPSQRDIITSRSLPRPGATPPIAAARRP